MVQVAAGDKIPLAWSQCAVSRNLVTLRGARIQNIFRPNSFELPYVDPLNHLNNSTGFMEMNPLHCCITLQVD
jgi:hypothetical protein